MQQFHSENIHYTVVGKPLFFRCPYYVWDDKVFAEQNKTKLVEKIWFPEEKIIFPNQRHTDLVAVITQESIWKEIEADAMITHQSWIVLWILTADCVPLIFSDHQSWTIWVIHAGWKWLQKNIIWKTFKKLEQEFDSKMEDIQISIWPAICQNCYEIWEEVAKNFQDKYLLPGEETKYYLDIKAVAQDQCIALWISPENLELSKICTYKAKQELHSYRRKTHTWEKGYGNNVSLIWKE